MYSLEVGALICRDLIHVISRSSLSINSSLDKQLQILCTGFFSQLDLNWTTDSAVH